MAASEPTTRSNIVAGSAVPLEAILTFARHTYGPSSHQAKEAFYRWCYTENPNCTDGLGAACVATTENGRVVGMMDKLYMEWNVHGTLMRIPSTGNFAIDPDHRKGGLGLRLIMHYMRGEAHVLVNGANANSAPLFRGLKYQELEGTYWGLVIHSRFRAAWRHLLNRIAGATPGALKISERSAFDGHTLTGTPDADLLKQLADLLNAPRAGVKLRWTPETVRWRFFHPSGPRHLLLYRADGTGTLRSAMLLSTGARRGLRISRAIAYHSTSTTDLEPLWRAAIAATRSLGIDVLAGFTHVPEEARMMTDLGLRKSAAPPATFFFHKRRGDAENFQDFLVQGAASDLGLEAIA